MKLIVKSILIFLGLVLITTVIDIALHPFGIKITEIPITYLN